MTVLVISAAASVAFLVFLILYISKTTGPFMAFCVGASAALPVAQVGGIHAFTMIAVLYVILTGLTFRARIRRRQAMLMLAAGGVALTAIWGELVISSSLALQLIAMATVAALLTLTMTPAHLLKAAGGFIAVASASAFVAALQAIGLLPAQLLQLEDAELHRPSGFYPEPDWLGLYCAGAVVLLFRVKLSPLIRILAVALNLFGVAYASARAAIVGLLVVAAVALIRSVLRKRSLRNKRTQKANRLVVMAVAVSSIGFVLLQPVQTELLVSRVLSSISSTDRDSAAEVRILQVQGMMELAESAPWYGNGLSAQGRVGGHGDVIYEDGVENTTASNWIVGLWGDAKIFSIPFIAFLLWACLRSKVPLGGRDLLILVLVNSLFSNALFFPVTWFALALGLTALAVKPRARNVVVLEQGSPRALPMDMAKPVL